MTLDRATPTAGIGASRGSDLGARLRAELDAVLAEAGTRPVPAGAVLFPEAGGAGHAALDREMRAELAVLRAGRDADPFSNPIQLLALRLGLRIDAGEVSWSDVEQWIQRLTAGAFLGGAGRLAGRMGETDPAANARIVRALIEGLARDPESGAAVPFETFRAAVERAPFGIVFTAHPTFALSATLLRIQAQLATGHDDRGRRLSTADRATLVRRVLAAEHRPEAVIDLATEHGFSLQAIAGARDALVRIYEIVFEVAREIWPDRWLEFRPRLLTIATWVGYDLDGRADIGWSEIFHRRLIVQRCQLVHYRDTAVELGGALSGVPEAEDLRHILELLESRLDLAVRMVEEEIDVFGRSEPDPVRRTRHVGRIARRMHAGRERRLNRAGPLIELVERALARAADFTGDGTVAAATLGRLAVLRAELANFGLGMAHTHVRLNATQIHNAIRREIGMEAAPDDPTHRRSYTAAVNALLGAVEPATINFGSLLNERASATRLMMVIAQMLKYVDATTPIRFLIAECETSFTLLAALYFAKQFGIADRVEISPLLETRKALERGPRMIDDVLANPHYRAYVEATGRLCVQTGYSDTGRNLGQTVAGASVERMRMRIGEVFARHGLGHVELVIFDTHGESIGRGAHPASFGDRLRYVSPPESRRRFARDGVLFKQETSFQGGDGYLWFFTPAAAFASVTRILEFALAPPGDEDGDPFYVEADYIAEFFTTIQFFYDSVMHDPDYAALLGAFGTNMMHPTGSRSLRRQHEPGAAVDLAHPSQLRAIPHNATLQQLGYLANTLAGAGRAIRKDPMAFRAMHASSPRFRRVFGLIAWALAFSDTDVLKAYVDTLDPGLWLLRTASSRIERKRFDELRAIGRFIEGHAHHDRLNGILRTLERDLFDMLQALAEPEADGDGDSGGGGVAGGDRGGGGRGDAASLGATDGDGVSGGHFGAGDVDATGGGGAGGAGRLKVGVPAIMIEDLRLLHVIRITLIQRIYMLATHIPEFSLRHDLSPEEVRTRILRLDIEEALEALGVIFPQDDTAGRPEDFGEPATYESDTGQSYAREHARIFQPMGKLYELVRRVSSGVNHVIGAMG